MASEFPVITFILHRQLLLINSSSLRLASLYREPWRSIVFILVQNKKPLRREVKRMRESSEEHRF
jgi:hypothetical protein